MLDGTFDFNQVNLVVGTRPIKGFEDGTEITAVRDAESFTEKVGVGGNVTRSRTNNKMGTITFTLEQFSSSNKFLTDLSNLDEASGSGVVPVKITDRSNPRVERVFAAEAWIQKPSDKSYGRESGPREWVIKCADLNFFQDS